MKRIGIEKINLYGSSLFLDQRKLALARDRDPQRVVADFLIDTRSLNPLYEDTVTMGANAAAPLLADEDKESIGLLVVGTESSIDFGKPISTNIHGALGLPSNVRNFETKHACYSGVAALDTALNWLAAGLNRGRKALVVSTDFSRMHLKAKEEFVLGGVAAAMLLSDSPKVIEYDLQRKGTWTTDVYDTFRPSARHEMGNNEVSLYSYLDALEGAYNDYVVASGNGAGLDFDRAFAHNCYHTPFPGMAFQAHRTLCNLVKPRSKAEIQESFTKRVLPSLRYARRVGSTYGASNFLGICGIVACSTGIKPGDTISFFTYGSGAIGEFYSGVLCPEAHEVVTKMGIDAALDGRREVDVPEYEEIETQREASIERGTYTPDASLPAGWYQKHYEGKKKLVLRQVKDFYRTYEWS
ncbi:MAG TPA: hydroxymethylglutaryl-CoA synthase [Spirochaetia bacterium]|nr:hydroxymethylglutaryl-CoA synthase [Spirochaetia bacterium]